MNVLTVLEQPALSVELTRNARTCRRLRQGLEGTGDAGSLRERLSE